MFKFSTVLDEDQVRREFDDQVRRGIFKPVARRLPADIAEERLQDAICQTYEMYKRYALESAKCYPTRSLAASTTDT